MELINTPEGFKSGFVNIIGKPNVGKSTLINALVGERMSIISHKPQTTRHRIMGILTNEKYQMVFSDTPGFIEKPSYKMHAVMNKFIQSSFDDADVFLVVTCPGDKYADDDLLLVALQKADVPVILVYNKSDLSTQEEILADIEIWKLRLKVLEAVPISAFNAYNIDRLLEVILSYLPEGPMYFPEDQLTDRLERFFVSEIIREKIFLQYSDEIPYTSEVMIEEFKDTETNAGVPIARIRAVIMVERDSQKGILLGRQGSAIKRLGTIARESIEQFLEKKVYLELTVKTTPKWRDNELFLKRMGYE